MVLKFTDGAPNPPLSDYSASIDWGDGHVTPGLVSRDSTVTGGFQVTGSNKYARFGTYKATIFVNDVGGSTLAIPLTVTVADAPLSSQGTSFGLVEGQTFSGTVATFIDGNPSAPLTDFTATVDWGDGTTPTTGSIVPGGSGGFLVKGTHVFDESGAKPWTITITVNDVGGQSTVATTTATVTDAPISATTTGVAALKAVEGTSFTGTIAYLSDGNPVATAADFTKLVIDWGDGTTSDLASGKITVTPRVGGVAGSFVIGGTHEYDVYGSYPIKVSITDDGGAAASTSNSITVADAPFIASGVGQSTAMEGVPFTAIVANFTDGNPHPRLGDFTATIDWGDATSSSGLIAQNKDGTFSITGNHIYEESTTPYTVTVAIQDSGGSTQTVSSSVFVPDAPLTASSTPISPAPSDGVRFNALVATFVDANPNPKPGEFTASIDWGDGSSSAGIVLQDGNHFDVRGSHLYKQGDYNISVSVQDDGGSRALAVSSVSVPDAPLTGSVPTGTLTPTEGTPLTLPVALFTSGNPQALPGDYVASIDWGDGTVTAGTVAAAVGGGFSVSGSHAYETVASFPIVATILSGGGSSAVVTNQATVKDAPLHAQSTLGYAPQIGVTANPTLVVFTDGDPNQPVTSYSAHIDWGDGHQSIGTITADPTIKGRFLVSAPHAYQASGAFTIAVGIVDIGGAGASVSIPVTVADPPITSVFLPFDSTVGTTFSTNVASFADPNPLANAGSFAAIVNWGDGTINAGIISEIAPDQYSVIGTHTFAASGAVPINVTIKDAAGTSSTAAGIVNVAVRTVPITGGLASSSVSSAGQADTSSPSFSGTGAPGDRLTLTAQRPDMAAPVVIGQTTIGANGAWQVTAPALLDGTYSIVASSVDASGFTSAPATTLPSIVIDTVSPRITGVTLNPKAGTAVIAIQDDRSGLLDAALANAANYSLSLPTSSGSQSVAITGITVSGGGPSATRYVTLDFASNNTKHAKGVLKAGHYVLAVNGSQITDASGNVLNEQFFTPTAPTGSKANSTYIAQIITNGSTANPPQSIHINAGSKPKPSKVKHHKAR